MGETLFNSNCAPCHGTGGQGGSGVPALDGSPIVTQDDPAAAIRKVLNGGGGMPAFRASLSNEQIAAILSYARNAWTNDASIVEPEQVEAER
jgi:mono/diheme cytochrome c family protein